MVLRDRGTRFQLFRWPICNVENYQYKFFCKVFSYKFLSLLLYLKKNDLSIF